MNVERAAQISYKCNFPRIRSRRLIVLYRRSGRESRTTSITVSMNFTSFETFREWKSDLVPVPLRLEVFSKVEGARTHRRQDENRSPRCSVEYNAEGRMTLNNAGYVHEAEREKRISKTSDAEGWARTRTRTRTLKRRGKRRSGSNRGTEMVRRSNRVAMASLGIVPRRTAFYRKGMSACT